MPDALPPQRSQVRTHDLDDPERKAYAPPVLHILGDALTLTQVAYGGLNKRLFGFLFAQSSPLLPGAPTR